MHHPTHSPPAGEAATALVQEALGYRFRDPSLLLLALGTGQPPIAPDAAMTRQRLEFLGDAAWNFAIAAGAFQAWPDASAGDLTRLRAVWCSTRGLADLARQLGLPPPDVSGPPGPSGMQALSCSGSLAATEASALTGTSDRSLAELLEAVLGAMVEDGGFDSIRSLACRVIAESGPGVGPPPVDPKSALQMLAQARHGTLPAYRLVERRGPPHSPTFRVVLSLQSPGLEIRTEAEGRTRQAAEQAAARMALERLGEIPES
jgi:ribonuclease-3